jgi:LysR family transcriptional regulator, low CO2-responsive transcriptional regulator
VHGGSVTAAAEELVVTQPSVSAALSALSRELGVDILERDGRGVRPSAAGQAFTPYAADVIGLIDQGVQAAREAAEVAARRLRIAAVTTAAESFVPPLMQAFSHHSPDVELTLDVGNRERVFRQLQERRADLAVAGRLPAGPPLDGAPLEALPLMDNELVLVTSAQDELATARIASADALGRRTWLLREEGSGTRLLNEQFLDAAGLRPRTLTLGSNGAIKQAARAGLGISFVSRAAVDLELDSGLLATIAVDRAPPARRWFILRSAAGPVRRPVEDFVAFARSPAAREAIEAARV